MLRRVAEALRAVWAWCDKNAGIILLTVIGAMAGAVALRRRDSHVNTTRQALELQSARDNIQRLQAERYGMALRDAMLEQRSAEMQREATKLKLEVIEHKRKAVALHHGITPQHAESLSDEDVESLFRSAGL